MSLNNKLCYGTELTAQGIQNVLAMMMMLQVFELFFFQKKPSTQQNIKMVRRKSVTCLFEDERNSTAGSFDMNRANKCVGNCTVCFM